ncbi:MAG: alpha/beta fold hydrolase [Kangiellaceae bacterium]
MKFLKLTGWVFIVLCGLGWGYHAYQDVEIKQLNEESRSALNAEFVKLSKGVTRYQLTGDKNAETVVLVHGYGVASYVWQPTYEFLETQGFRVLSLDLYGHGYSDRPDEVYGVELFAEQINELVEALNINKPFHLLGLSMGGTIVSHFAHRFPEKLKSLILQDPLVINLGEDRIYPLTIPLVGEYLFNVFLMPRNIESHANKPGKGEAFETYGDNYLEQAEYEGFRNAMLSALRFMATHDYNYEYQELAKTKMPKLLIWGSEDKTVPIKQASILLDLMPELSYEIIDGAGHVPSMEVPNKFNPILLNWLEKQKENSHEG